MEAVLERAHAVQPKLNCFIRIDADVALEAAKGADRDLARGYVRGPLHGVPMAHKDMYYRAGVVSTCGSKIARERPAQATATALERLDAAGAIQFGVLNMAEFAFNPTGHNWHYGHCRNPWDPKRITGGSSSGSGSATAARATFAALGSDTGGSIRLPAHFCGTSGIKPTYARVSRAGAMPLSFSLDTVGPLTRTVADAALIAQLLAGADARDPTCDPRPVPDWMAQLARPVAGLRIGRPRQYFYDECDAEIAAAMEASLEVFRRLGATVVDVDLPDMAPWNAAGTLIIGAEAPQSTANGCAPARRTTPISCAAGSSRGSRCLPPPTLTRCACAARRSPSSARKCSPRSICCMPRCSLSRRRPSRRPTSAAATGRSSCSLR